MGYNQITKPGLEFLHKLLTEVIIRSNMIGRESDLGQTADLSVFGCSSHSCHGNRSLERCLDNNCVGIVRSSTCGMEPLPS